MTYENYMKFKYEVLLKCIYTFLKKNIWLMAAFLL